MPSCQFKSQPLVSAVAKIGLDGTQSVSLDRIWSVREAVSEAMPSVAYFGGEENPLPGFRIVVSQAPHQASSGLSVYGSSLRLSLSPNEIVISWEAGLTEYPRFITLCHWLRIAYAAFGSPRAVYTNLQYVNHAPNCKWNTLVNLPGFGDQHSQGVLEANYSFLYRNSLEARVQVADLVTTETPVALVSTVGGCMVDGGSDPVDQLVQLVHPNMQQLLDSMLSDFAKQEWGYDGIR